MERKKFLDKMKSATTFINTSRLACLVKRSIKLGNDFKFGKGSINLIITMEELAELQKEISKWLRGKGDKVALTEEIADVSIMLEYLKIIADIDQIDVNRAINVKLDRLEERDDELVSKGKE